MVVMESLKHLFQLGQIALGQKNTTQCHQGKSIRNYLPYWPSSDAAMHQTLEGHGCIAENGIWFDIMWSTIWQPLSTSGTSQSVVRREDLYESTKTVMLCPSSKPTQLELPTGLNFSSQHRYPTCSLIRSSILCTVLMVLNQWESDAYTCTARIFIVAREYLYPAMKQICHLLWVPWGEASSSRAKTACGMVSVVASTDPFGQTATLKTSARLKRQLVIPHEC